VFSAKSLRAQLRLPGSGQGRASTRPTNTSPLKSQNRENRKAGKRGVLKTGKTEIKYRRESIDNALAPEFRAVDDRFFRNKAPWSPEIQKAGKPVIRKATLRNGNLRNGNPLTMQLGPPHGYTVEIPKSGNPESPIARNEALSNPRRAVCCAPLRAPVLRYMVGRILNRVSRKPRKRESRRHGNRVIVELGEPESLKARKPENPKQGVQ
jgi:hypothetical protein